MGRYNRVSQMAIMGLVKEVIMGVCQRGKNGDQSERENGFSQTGGRGGEGITG